MLACPLSNSQPPRSSHSTPPKKKQAGDAVVAALLPPEPCTVRSLPARLLLLLLRCLLFTKSVRVRAC